MKPTPFILIEAATLDQLPKLKTGINLNAINQYRCEKCKAFYPTNHLATLCCNPNCCECGKELPANKQGVTGIYSQVRCPECAKASMQKRQNALQAEMVRQSRMIAMPTGCFVYHPSFPNEGFLDLDDYKANGWTLAEIVADVCAHYGPKPIPVPAYVFDCDPEEWKGLDIDDLITNELEEWYEGAESCVNGLEELREAVKAFNDKQTLTQHHRADRLIVLDAEAFTKLIQELV